MNSQAKRNENQDPTNVSPLLRAMVVVLVAAPFLAYALLSVCGQGSAKESTR